MSFRAGIVGYGLAGKVFHAPLLAPAGIELAAVASSNAVKVQEDFPGMKVYPTPQDLFADDSLDLVILASPSPTHYPLALAALAAGRNVVVDKPLAPTSKHVDDLIAAAEKAGKIVTCYQNRRWDSDHLTFCKLLEEDRLGEIHQYEAHFEFYKPEADPTAKWQEQANDAVGVHYDLGAHLIDQPIKLWGLPDWVQGEGLTQRPGGEIIDNFYVRMAYGKKRVTIFGSLYCADYKSRLLVHGSKASYRKYHMDPQEAQLRAGMTPADEGYGVETQSAWGTISHVENGQVIETPCPSLTGSYQSFYQLTREAIQNGTQPPVPPQQTRNTIRVIEALIESGNKGQRIYF